MIQFSEAQLERYSRNILLNDIGIEGQSNIMQSKVLVIGTGGLGAPVCFYLAAAGIGTIGIVDADAVELSNLQRQIIHFTNDIGVPKVDSAKQKMVTLNPDVTVHTFHEYVKADTILDIIDGYDFVVDGTDNFPSKFLINDACIKAGVSFSHGGVLGFTGQTMTVIPGKSACYRCVFGKSPPKDAVPSTSQAGILGAIAGTLGTIQATEVLKHVTGAGVPLTNVLLTFDASTMEFRKASVRKNPSCAICGENPTIHELFGEEKGTCDLKKT